ncbi:MAG: hypothetical protein AAGK97_10340 [Bacteroidota bacterium]
MNKEEQVLENPDQRPPIGGTWNRLYALVLILHFLFIGLFYLLTVMYS